MFTGIKSKLHKRPLGPLKKGLVWGIDKIDNNTFQAGWNFVCACISWLRKHNANCSEGIFRKSGSEARIKELQVLTCQKIDNFVFGDEEDPHVIANLLKRYFKEIKDPIFTWDLYSTFIAASAEEDEASRSRAIKTALALLPVSNFKILELLLQYLNELSKVPEKTLMDVHNLSIVWSPNVLRPKVETPLILISDAGHATSLLENLVDGIDTYFRLKPTPIQKEEMKIFTNTMRRKYSSHSMNSFEALKQVKDEQGLNDDTWKEKLENIGIRLKRGDERTLQTFFDDSPEEQKSANHPKHISKHNRSLSMVRPKRKDIFKDLTTVVENEDEKVTTLTESEEATHSQPELRLEDSESDQSHTTQTETPTPSTDSQPANECEQPTNQDKPPKTEESGENLKTSKKEQPNQKEEESEVSSGGGEYIKDSDVQRELKAIMSQVMGDESAFDSAESDKEELKNLLTQIYY